jgi:transposase
MVSRVCDGPPLPLPYEGSVPVKAGIDLLEHRDGAGAVFVWGNPAWYWTPDDVIGRRLAAVQLVANRHATLRQVAEAFKVSHDVLRSWRKAYEQGGTAALAPQPKGPSKLTAAKIAEITAVRGEGLAMREVAKRTGVSLNSVSRALAAQRPASTEPATPEPDEVEQPDDVEADEVAVDQQDDVEVEGLVALARPLPRTAERQAARAGLLAEAPPVITQGAGLPLA